ncbi:MAG: AMP-binding protein [Clostridia bacterium]|nr:AMP-binding protein [Clostridia bacterium]
MKYISERFMENVKSGPDLPFLYDDRNPEGITFAEFNTSSACVYAWLKSHGIRREDFVLISLPRGVLPYIAAVGVWKAGAAFVIVEEDYARERIAFIREDCGCRVELNLELYQEMMNMSPLEGYELENCTLRAYAVLGCYPSDVAGETVELSFIDETARAVVLLSGTSREFTVFHPFNAYLVEVGEIARVLNLCDIPVEEVGHDAFSRRLQEGLTREDISGYLSTLVHYDLSDGEVRESIPVDNQFTIQALSRLGFSWTAADRQIIRRMIESLKRRGFFDCVMERTR